MSEWCVHECTGIILLDLVLVGWVNTGAAGRARCCTFSCPLCDLWLMWHGICLPLCVCLTAGLLESS